MEILNKIELKLQVNQIIEKIKEGAIFIHPTDTIYGIGCNALNQKSVEKIRQLKERPTQPLSIWIPSIDWIKYNCKIDKKAEKWIEELPGPYTLILKLKHENAIAKNVSQKTIGVRIPDHWFSEIIKEANIPIITTSANKAGKPFMEDKEDLDQEIEKGIDFMIYEGKKQARPSKIINVETENIKKR